MCLQQIIIEHLFRVIPALCGFGHGGLAGSKEPGEQDGAFYLCAGNGRLVMNRVKPCAVDFERRGLFRAVSGDPGTHEAEGANHAVHGSARKGWVSGEFAAERLPCEQTREQSHERTGVPAIDRLGRRSEMAVAAMDDERRRFRLLDLHAECTHGIHGALAIFPRQKAGYDTGAV